MPRKKTAPDTEFTTDSEISEKDTSGKKTFNKTHLGIIAVILVILGILLFQNKDLFLAALVNNRPIFTWEMNSLMRSKYGQTTLDEAITEKLINEEATKKGIKVTEKQIDEKVNETEASLNGQIKLEEALKQQGRTMADFREQIKYSLLIEGLLEGKVKVTDKEAEDYLEKNKEYLESMAGTDSAQLKKYAYESIKREKLTTEFESWFNGIKAKSKINRFW